MSTIVPFSNENPEAMFICPYDSVHVVRACRFNQHLRKCRKNHGGKGFEICPFNESHHVPTKGFEHHVKFSCPDKHVIEKDVEQARGLQKHFLPPVEHHPNWQKPESNEDWDQEFEEHQQILTIAAEEQALEEAEEEEEIIEIKKLLPEKPGNWDQMSAAQKKNYKRRYNKQQQRMADLGLTASDLQRSENPEDWTDDEREAKLKAILSLYPPPTGKIESQFVDFKSVLNQYCQKNKINPPKYNEVAAGTMFGGFTFECVVQMKNYRSHGNQKTKKDAAHNAAKWALLAMKLPQEENFFSKPRPIRPVSDLTSLRQAHEVGLLHEAGQLPSRPAPAAERSPARPTPVSVPAQQPRLLPPDSFAKPSAGIEASMRGLSVEQQPTVQDAGWSTVVGRHGGNKSGRGRGRGTALATF